MATIALVLLWLGMCQELQLPDISTILYFLAITTCFMSGIRPVLWQISRKCQHMNSCTIGTRLLFPLLQWPSLAGQPLHKRMYNVGGHYSSFSFPPKSWETWIYKILWLQHDCYTQVWTTTACRSCTLVSLSTTKRKTCIGTCECSKKEALGRHNYNNNIMWPAVRKRPCI